LLINKLTHLRGASRVAEPSHKSFDTP
jgi:hypothetical protein